MVVLSGPNQKSPHDFISATNNANNKTGITITAAIPA